MRAKYLLVFLGANAAVVVGDLDVKLVGTRHNLLVLALAHVCSNL